MCVYSIPAVTVSFQGRLDHTTGYLYGFMVQELETFSIGMQVHGIILVLYEEDDGKEGSHIDLFTCHGSRRYSAAAKDSTINIVG